MNGEEDEDHQEKSIPGFTCFCKKNNGIFYPEDQYHQIRDQADQSGAEELVEIGGMGIGNVPSHGFRKGPNMRRDPETVVTVAENRAPTDKLHGRFPYGGSPGKGQRLFGISSQEHDFKQIRRQNLIDQYPEDQANECEPGQVRQDFPLIGGFYDVKNGDREECTEKGRAGLREDQKQERDRRGDPLKNAVATLGSFRQGNGSEEHHDAVDRLNIRVYASGKTIFIRQGFKNMGDDLDGYSGKKKDGREIENALGNEIHRKTACQYDGATTKDSETDQLPDGPWDIDGPCDACQGPDPEKEERPCERFIILKVVSSFDEHHAEQGKKSKREKRSASLHIPLDGSIFQTCCFLRGGAAFDGRSFV